MKLSSVLKELTLAFFLPTAGRTLSFPDYTEFLPAPYPGQDTCTTCGTEAHSEACGKAYGDWPSPSCTPPASPPPASPLGIPTLPFLLSVLSG